MTDHDAQPASLSGSPVQDEPESGDRRLRLIVFGVLALAWVGFLAFGQVRARFWIRNEFQIEWKPVFGIWRVAIGELPGGLAVQGLVLASIAVVVVGVIGCLYLLLTADVAEPDQETSS